MPKQSSTSVRVFSVDRQRVETTISRWASEVRRSHPEIERIYWFGSWFVGTPTPGSDVDLRIIVRESVKPFRDRSADYRPDLPIPIDILVYTREEFEQLVKETAPIVREIMRGRSL